MRSLIIFVAVVVLALITFNLFTFSVDETQVAVVLEFGEIKRTETEPGIKFKVPFIQTVSYFDSRLQLYDVSADEIIISDPVVGQLTVFIDNYALWRVSDADKFRSNVGGSFAQARSRLDNIIFSNVRNVLGGQTLEEILVTNRDESIQLFTSTSASEATTIGVEVVDVRLKRTDLPDEIKSDIYRLMSADRQQAATNLRAEGEKRSREIRSDADKQVTIIRANAEREALETRGEGDAEALRTYADSYSQNPEFYRFWRTLLSYRDTFNIPGSGTMVLSTESEYLDLFDIESLESLVERVKPNN
jgi:membrane protease subunit HflC